MAEYAVSIVLALAVSVFTFRPLFAARGNDAEDAGEGDRLRALYETRDRYYSLIRDVELDRDMGKLSEEDYSALMSGYKEKAASAARDISELESRSGRAERDI